MDIKEMNVTPGNVNVQAAGNPAPVPSSPEPGKKSSGKFVFFMIGLAIGVCVTSVLLMLTAQITGGFGRVTRLEGKGYDTPEEAVMAYAEYLQAGDFDGIISTFAMESYVDNYSVEEYYDRIRVFSYVLASGAQQNVKLVNDSDLAASVNLENRRAYISTNVYRQMIVSMSAQFDDEEMTSGLESGLTITISDDDDLETLMDFLGSSPEFQEMEIGKFVKESEFNPDYKRGIKEYNKAKKKAWGGEIENVCLRVEIDGEDYILFMTCVCYEDRWYIAEFSNYFGLVGSVKPLSAGLCSEDSYGGFD